MNIFKPLDADKLRDKTINSQYNKLIKNFNKLADENKESYVAIVSNLQDYTRLKLIANGFNLDYYEQGGYKLVRISWPQLP